MADGNDEDDDLWEVLRDEGDLVASKEWDSGGPGAGAGTNNVYHHRGKFYATDDGGAYGPFPTFAEAGQAVGLLGVNEATTNIWVAPGYADEDVDALNRKAAELRQTHEEKWRKDRS